jgi:DNA-binding CsgD family transcriptional regulator
LRREASEAADRGLALARRIGTRSKTVQQTLAFIALTFVLLRRQARAAKVLADPLLRGGINERLARFVFVVERLAARWASGAAADDLADALEALEDCDLGGLARLIEALPLPETARSRSAQLTAAERDVLGWLAAGLSPKDIAFGSGRSVGRVDAQIVSLCRKLGCMGRHHAVAVALDEGLLYDMNVRSVLAPPPAARERRGA